MKMRRICLFIFMVMLLVPCACNRQPDRPNILIILADDLGYGDLQCYEPRSLIPTPNLDRLAKEGIRFTDAYCPVSVCTPTRYALMTGEYSFRSWKDQGVLASYEPSAIEEQQLTLPEMLKKSGYTTAGFGKWHLGATFQTLDGRKPAGYGKFRADNMGANVDVSSPVAGGPVSHGFDRWMGWSCTTENWILDGDKVTAVLTGHINTTDATPNTAHLDRVAVEDFLPYMTGYCLDFLGKHASGNRDNPFFLYYAAYVPHLPLAVLKDFRGVTKAGLYGDYVHELDHYTGKILHALDSLDLSRNTLVIFASDNGSQFYATSVDDRISLRNNRSGRRPADALAAGEVHLPNGPLSGGKWTIWEGGVRTPLIARWPGHFPEGTVSTNLMALNDVMATLAAVIGYDLPEGTAVDSYNMLPVLKGDDSPVRKNVVMQSGRKDYALRSGDWKLILRDSTAMVPGGPKEELYNLSADPTESTNLVSKYPEKAKELKKELVSILD